MGHQKRSESSVSIVAKIRNTHSELTMELFLSVGIGIARRTDTKIPCAIKREDNSIQRNGNGNSSGCSKGRKRERSFPLKNSRSEHTAL